MGEAKADGFSLVTLPSGAVNTTQRPADNGATVYSASLTLDADGH